MKFLEEYRDVHVAQKLLKRLLSATTRSWTIMEVCGGQTHSILQYGIEELLPAGVELVHGPGCPICVTPLETIDKAIAIAELSGVIFCSFGDMLRVPGSKRDLLDVKAHGGDVRIVYSPLDSVTIAKANPDKEVVFFAVGFETTAPANAMAIMQAKRMGVNNFSVLCAHVTVPQVVSVMLQSPENRVQAFLGPGHVCTVMGYREYEEISRQFKVPIVITGFEPIDILDGILRCVLQLEEGRAEVENQYSRAVSRAGNGEARNIVAEVFQPADTMWRGLGPIPHSGYRLSEAYRDFDANARFEVDAISVAESPVCISGQILRGQKKPPECPAFGKACKPEHPLGATMVSSEGTCANYYKFKRISEDSI